MFPGKTGHGRDPRPAGYGSADSARVRRRFGFPRPGSPARSGLQHRPRALPDRQSGVLPAARAGAAHPAAYPCPDHVMTHSVPGVRIRHLHALSERQPQTGPTMQQDHAAGRLMTPIRYMSSWLAYGGCDARRRSIPPPQPLGRPLSASSPWVPHMAAQLGGGRPAGWHPETLTRTLTLPSGEA
jgi:hypothetical protein